MKSFPIYSIPHTEESGGSTKTALWNSKELRDFLNYCTHYDDVYITAAYGDEKACVNLAEHYLGTTVDLPELTDSSLLALAYANKCVFILADVQKYF